MFIFGQVPKVHIFDEGTQSIKVSGVMLLGFTAGDCFAIVRQYWIYIQLLGGVEWPTRVSRQNRHNDMK
jgi:hypothetical protein